MVLLCELFNHQEFVFSPLSKCVVCDIFMSWCLFSHPNLVWPLRDWFVGCILTDNSSRRQRWRRWRGRALWCAPWHPHAPRTVANLTVCLGQIWICQFLISKHTHIDTHAHTQLNTHTGRAGIKGDDEGHDDFSNPCFCHFLNLGKTNRVLRRQKSVDYVGLPNQKQSACKMVNNWVE